MIFAQWGSEASIEKFFTWLVQRARSRPNKMEHFNQYFTAITWQLCMNLRQGISFEWTNSPSSCPETWPTTD